MKKPVETPGEWADEKLRRSNVDWSSLLPLSVAEQQAEWERQRTALAMRAAGLTIHEVGEKFGVGIEKTRILLGQAERRSSRPSPIDAYFMQSESEVFEKIRLASW
ncbi:MAG TPA: hypothetical protein VMA55_20565 [Acidovorax sp.]|nr:hypothetical protein [Acidovorax sp.]